MNIDINLNVILKPSEEFMNFLTGLIHPMFQINVPQIAEKVKPEITVKDGMPALAKGGVIPTKEQVKAIAEVIAEAVEEAPKKKTKAEAKAELTAAIATVGDILPGKAPTEGSFVPKTLDDIRTLCTNMADHQNFNVREFLNKLGYKRMSDLPVEEWNAVYEAVKKLEVDF